jgi:hypothetical protein
MRVSPVFVEKRWKVFRRTAALGTEITSRCCRAGFGEPRAHSHDSEQNLITVCSARQPLCIRLSSRMRPMTGTRFWDLKSFTEN